MADSKHGFEVVDLRESKGGWVVQWEDLSDGWVGRHPLHPSKESADGEMLYQQFRSPNVAYRVINLRDQEPGEWRVEWSCNTTEWCRCAAIHPSEESAAGEIRAAEVLSGFTYRIARIK